MPLSWIPDNFPEIKKKILATQGLKSPGWEIGCGDGKLQEIAKSDESKCKNICIMLMQGRHYIEDPAVTHYLELDRSFAIRRGVQTFSFGGPNAWGGVMPKQGVNGNYLSGFRIMWTISTQLNM